MTVRSDKWFINNIFNNCIFIAEFVELGFTSEFIIENGNELKIITPFKTFKRHHEGRHPEATEPSYLMQVIRHVLDTQQNPDIFVCLYRLLSNSGLNSTQLKNFVNGYTVQITKSDKQFNPIIYPYVVDSINIDQETKKKIPSYGQSSLGYDIRLGNKFVIFEDSSDLTFSPLEDNSIPQKTVEFESGILLKPNQFVLGHSVEKIKVPDDHIVVCMAKSTIARWGVNVSVTPLEPGWEGFITLEIHNQRSCNVLLPVNIGIMQMLFFEGDQTPLKCYSDKGGKYQNQAKEPVTAKL